MPQDVCGVRDGGAMRVRAAWLIEGVRMDGPVRMAPLSLSPVSLDRGYVGREAREIFNAELTDAGFVTAVGDRFGGHRSRRIAGSSVSSAMSSISTACLRSAPSAR